MAELAGYARFRDAMERAHTTTADSDRFRDAMERVHTAADPARTEREPAATASAVTTSPSG
ncbi:hypothetical protein PUR59_10040 [Streptomyces sp. SP18ES09]|uniref:hypothetical protein n=1 Tax=Streptomyces sp. SP18ES09 TaxID=3002532 RepID=UPI002E77B991|nr:hypothetical protein [Streptomyces sp. SP18ES09]MEE1815351.1 hypothetical protein [Streptomyces sp. SP18ES09]